MADVESLLLAVRAEIWAERRQEAEQSPTEVSVADRKAGGHVARNVDASFDAYFPPAETHQQTRRRRQWQQEWESDRGPAVAAPHAAPRVNQAQPPSLAEFLAPGEDVRTRQLQWQQEWESDRGPAAAAPHAAPRVN